LFLLGVAAVRAGKGNFNHFSFYGGKVMAKTFKVDTSRHIADGFVKAFMILHLSPKGYYLLTTIGRKSGKPRSNPVVLIEEGKRRWLVAPFGEVSWVYNIKANGKVTLTRNGKSEKVSVQEVTVE
jgi:hypothetical protein